VAVMIPSSPHDYEKSSLEGIMFAALTELDDKYYVFHSLKVASVDNNVFEEREGDFVIFHPQKGILCLEAKAGRIRNEKGRWLYSNGVVMKRGGPFRQADTFKNKLIDAIISSGNGDLLSKCRLLHGVWFPSVDAKHVDGIQLPMECVRSQILTMEALSEPNKYIEKLFNTKVEVMGEVVDTSLSEDETNRLIKHVLCPEFEILPTNTSEYDIKKIHFNQLLAEQANVLNFLVEQKTAVINGAAGTGKTMVALEKARRHSERGEKVLFLCYNAALRQFLEQNFSYKGVDYYTIAAYACKLGRTSKPDYLALSEELLKLDEAEAFPYKHVIIDEGQDFGLDNIEESDAIELLKAIITERSDGTFYVFYDNLQLVQSNRIPRFISEADCKLTLYRNCRNTISIAKTSLKPITERNPLLMDGSVNGAPTTMSFCRTEDSIIKEIDRTIDKMRKKGIEDIVLLSCSTESKSVASNYINNERYKEDILFSTCRKFKGLEADGIILIDVTRKTFNSDSVLLFYVGASRARLELSIITDLNNDECTEILTDCLAWKGRMRNPKNTLALALDSAGFVK